MAMQLSRALMLSVVLAFGAVSALAQVNPASSSTSGTPAAVQAAQESTANVFYPDAAAKPIIDDAMRQAQQTNRRVLVIYGGTWCAHCAELQKAIESSPDAAGDREAYVTAHVTADNLAELQQFAQRLDPDLKVTKETGPLITIVGKNGELIEARTATRLLDNGTVSAAKVTKFLDRFAPLAPASEVYDKGLAQLRSSGKLGFVEFGADWCTWCHHMDKFFDQSAAAPILQNYFLRIPIDYERNEGAPELAKQLGAPAGQGLPLWVVVNAAGKPLANSNSPKGNIGFPGTPEEIAEFVNVMRTTAPGIAPAQLVIIQKTLEEKPVAQPGH